MSDKLFTVLSIPALMLIGFLQTVDTFPPKKNGEHKPAVAVRHHFVTSIDKFPNPFVARVTDIRVIDGDTIEGDIHLPLNVALEDQHIRFLGVDTWEMRGSERPRGLVAKAYTRTAIQSGTVWIELIGTKERDSFGRVLACPYIQQPNGRFRDLSRELITNGHGTKEEIR